MDKSVRSRINVSTLAKGHKTYDCTVEIKYEGEEDEMPSNGQIKAENLLSSDALVAELDQRYPAPVEGN